MSLKNYILAIISISSICYGIYAFWSMVFNCQTPFYIECIGTKLDNHNTIAISNKVTTESDTLYFNYEQSKAIMPSTLGIIKFDSSTNTFVLQNNTCVYNPNNGKPSNYFLPFSHTLNDPWYSRGKYFSSNEIIPQSILMINGVKYNSAVGTKENRISVKLFEFNNNTYLKFKDDGINTKYLVKVNTNNKYDIFLNHPVLSDNKFIFSFDNTTKNKGHYIINIKASIFSFAGVVKNESGNLKYTINDRKNTFDVEGFLFKVSPKYSISFTILYGLFLIVLIVFQWYFFFTMLKFKSEVFESLYGIRILINSLVFLGIPIFLTSYIIDDSRSLFLILAIILNLTYFTPKNILHRAKLLSNLKYSNSFVYLFLLVLVIILWKFTSSELFLGIMPILHIQKLALLIVIFVTQLNSFDKYKFNKWTRILFIIGFSILVSALTSDLGSCIYTGLSILLIELIKKTIKLKYVLLSTIGLIIIIICSFKTNPNTFSGSKSYRIVAPYTLPSNENLFDAKQADRETYAGINYILKNRLDNTLPRFNKLIVPNSFKSTMHTDFSVLWSFAFGGYAFAFIFGCVIIALCRELLLLLYLCTRVVRINKEKYFALPITREGELVRFYLAFTIIQFVYPICFSTLMLPLTGQSLPALAISNWELVFLAMLLVALHSIFTNPEYFTKTGRTQYTFTDAKKSIRFVITFFIVLIATGFIFKSFIIKNLNNTMQWQKHTKDEDIKQIKHIPSSSDKFKLVEFTKEIIGDDDLTSISKKKKPVLKELASLYYTSKPYSQSVFESRTYNISSFKMLAQMSTDSISKMDKKQISGKFAPFGIVYSNNQVVNNKPINSVSNKYYSSIPANTETLNADLTAACTKEIESHIQEIGKNSNIGVIMIIENQTGNVIANSSYPINSEINSNQVHYLIGSLKKLLVAYAGLQLLPNVKNQIFNNMTFKEFIQTSDDIYAAELLKNLLQLEKDKFSQLLLKDFDLPLYMITEDSFLDSMPTENDFRSKLDRNNIIYRQSIGMQAPYTFETVLTWYCRVASGLKVNFKYNYDNSDFDNLSMSEENLNYLKKCFNSVLNGTADKVRLQLISNGINTTNIFCKTGTAEKSNKKGNASSSFVICTDKYTIGVMLSGSIPNNDKNQSAKDLFNKLIPIFKQQKILPKKK